MVSLLNAIPSRRTVDRARAVLVNGVTISRAAIAQEVQNHPSSTPAEAWTKAASALAVRELLLQEARRLGIEPDPEVDEDGRRETDEEALVRMLIAREVRTPNPAEDECRRVFQANRARFRSPSLYEVRHILFAANRHDEVARAAAQAQAEAVIAQLDASPHLFSDLAALHSACPSAGTGGSLGQIGPSQTVPEFEAALDRLPVGRVAPQPVVTRYGLHVVLVDRKIEGVELPFELARAPITRWLTERVRRTAIRQYIGLLAGRAHIEGVDLAMPASPLVQ